MTLAFQTLFLISFSFLSMWYLVRWTGDGLSAESSSERWQILRTYRQYNELELGGCCKNSSLSGLFLAVPILQDFSNIPLCLYPTPALQENKRRQCISSTTRCSPVLELLDVTGELTLLSAPGPVPSHEALEWPSIESLSLLLDSIWIAQRVNARQHCSDRRTQSRRIQDNTMLGKTGQTSEDWATV